MDAAEWNHSVRDQTNQNAPLRDTNGRRSGLSAEEKVDKTKGDPRGDLQRQADKTKGGDQQQSPDGYRGHWRMLRYRCGRVQGCIQGSRGEATSVFSRCPHRRQSRRDHRLRSAHGALIYSAEAHLRRPDQRKVYPSQDRTCGIYHKRRRVRDRP